MDRCQDIFTNHTFVEHDGIFVVITLPRHVGNEKVAAKCQLTILRSVTLGEDIACLHALAFVAYWPKVYRHILIGTTELGDAILLKGWLEADKFFFFRTIIQDADSSGVNVFYDTVCFRSYHRAGVFTHLFFNAGTNNRCLVVKQWNSLTHHVRTHECTVGIIMLQERDKGCCNRSNLLGSNVHIVHLGWGNNRIICILTTFDNRTNERTIISQGCISLTDNLLFFILCSQVFHMVKIQVCNSVDNLTVWRLNKA